MAADSSDQEQGNNTPPQKPTYRNFKDMFSHWEETKPAPRPKKPDDASPKSSDTDITENSQEARFRLAAIKLAEMEDKLVSYMQQSTARDGQNTIAEGAYLIKTPPGGYFLNVYKGENIQQYNGKSARITFQFSPDRVVDRARELDIQATISLNLGLYADRDSQEVFEAYAKTHGTAGNFSTTYLVNNSGDYGKAVTVENDFPMPGRKRLGEQPESKMEKNSLQSKNQMVSYESTMDEHDFEIAGQAISMLIKRLKPPEAPTAPQT